MTVTLSHIVAAAENDVIGREGGLPWHIPEDLKFFKDKTLGHAIIMGRKTYESVGRPLPKRLNVIVTRQKDYHPEGTAVFPSLAEAIAYCERESATWGEEIFIAGGGEIFEQSMDMVDKIYLTRIHQEIPGDTYYPQMPLDKFEEIERNERQEPVPFTFLTFKRK
ncbi:MAG: dihydrofolate reductase [Bdellovibrionaceae bacterium]|nr:dihydrofolate reductase [Bdellovibrionales bacterium]MCB9086427.1 dihydrofolate reductase [Pseudobdellovibrionaceae bacterium]